VKIQSEILILKTVESALNDHPNLRYYTTEEVPYLLFVGGYLQEEPAVPFVANALATVGVEEQAFDPNISPAG